MKEEASLIIGVKDGAVDGGHHCIPFETSDVSFDLIMERN